MRPAARIRNPVMPGYLHSGGTDDGPSVYPFWVSINWRDVVAAGYDALRSFARKERPTLVWILALTAGCIGMAVLLVLRGYGLPVWWQFAALAIVTAATERQSVREM